MAASFGKINHMAVISWMAVLFLTISIVTVSSKSYEDMRCPEAYNCSCSNSLGSYKIICGIPGSQLTEIGFDARNNVKLECVSNNYKYSDMPSNLFNRSIESVESFTFYNCPLPNEHIIDAVNKIGFKKAKHIVFKRDKREGVRNFKRIHLKGLNDVTGLDLSNDDIENVFEDLFDDMKCLKRLNLENNRIILELGLFKALPDLESLNLNQNRLTDIPQGLFKYSKSLKELYLRQNCLKNITSANFESLIGIGKLDLSLNNMVNIPSDIFYNLPKLIELNLSSNSLYAFPQELFVQNNNLEIIDLSNNEQSLMKIPMKLIHHLEKLKVFNLKNCAVSIIPESFFWNLTEIVNISLDGNSLSKVQDNLFKDQTNLIFLDLNGNDIKLISNLAFRSMAKLEILKMDNNKMSHISGKIFENLIALKELSMKNNEIREIDSSAFINNPNIVTIDLSHNMLTLSEGNELLEYAHLREIIEARSPFHCLDKLEHLNLSHNLVSEIFSDWKYELLNIKSLDLSYNNISHILFGNLNFLSSGIEVDLRHNYISTIDFKTANHYFQPGTVNEDSLSTTSAKVFIENNPVHCDCVLYGFIRYLEGKLSPHVKNIVRVESGSTRCASPRELEGRLLADLKEDEMLCPLDEPESHYAKMCPTNCTCFVRVSDKSIIVNCSNSHSKLSTITLPNVKLNNLNCTEVHFERNHLQDLSLFSSKRSTFNQITKLFIAGNNISYLNIEDIPSRIEHLDLRNNLLTHISTGVVDALDKSASLKYFWISGNPLECDAENVPLFSFLENSYFKIKDFDNVTCSGGKSISSFMKQRSETKTIT